MKKLSILFISFLTVISAFLTSCDEDHYGPAPVDVTANYSNKISNPNPNLVLTYNGDAMNGKSRIENTGNLLISVLLQEKLLSLLSTIFFREKRQ